MVKASIMLRKLLDKKALQSYTTFRAFFALVVYLTLCRVLIASHDVHVKQNYNVKLSN